jgi:acyl-CoA thioester hydrolase
MGYVYYGQFASYFEVGRVEALRDLNVSYKTLEDNGIMMPVLSYSIKYYKPAFYDNELQIKTCIREMPGSRIKFHYQTFNEKMELLNEAETELVFILAKTRRPIRLPDVLANALQAYFS